MTLKPARIAQLIAVVTLLLTVADHGIQARRERLGLRHVALDLPGPPSKVIAHDLDGDGRQDLLVVLAYSLIEALRRLGLEGTALANAYCGTIRLRLLKIGARVRITVRKVWVSLASSHPAEKVFAHAYHRLPRGST